MAETAAAVSITLWGVRGTFPAIGPEFSLYGGDTICIEIGFRGERLILDAGTGLKKLGAVMAREPVPRAAILLSHGHLDHVAGLQQFAPFWQAAAEIDLYIPALLGACQIAGIQAVLGPPFFPREAAVFPGKIAWRRFAEADRLTLGPFAVESFPVRHPGGACGFVVEVGARRITFVTDHEHGDASADSIVCDRMVGADLVLYDATFTEAELAARKGWGHSTAEAALAFRQQSGAERMVLIHHEPSRVDADLAALEADITARDPRVRLARGGEKLAL